MEPNALIASQNEQIVRLQREKDDLSRALKVERNGKGGTKALKAEVEGLKGQLGDLTRERDGLKGAASAAPTDKDKRIRDLEGQLRQRDHRTAFEKAAGTARVKPEAIDDLYSLSGLKPGDAEPKPEDFAEYLATAKEGRPWAFGEATTTADGGSTVVPDTGESQGPAKLPATPKPSGAGRGAPDTASGRLVVKHSQLADGTWMKANQGRIAEAQKNGSLVMQPG